MTVPGIMAHEIGHHVHFVRGTIPIARIMRSIVRMEAPNPMNFILVFIFSGWCKTNNRRRL